MAVDLNNPPRLDGRPEDTQRALINWMHTSHQQTVNILNAFDEKLAAIAAVAQLTQTISATPTQAEVQAIQAKVNEIIAAAQ